MSVIERRENGTGGVLLDHFLWPSVNINWLLSLMGRFRLIIFCLLIVIGLIGLIGIERAAVLTVSMVCRVSGLGILFFEILLRVVLYLGLLSPLFYSLGLRTAKSLWSWNWHLWRMLFNIMSTGVKLHASFSRTITLLGHFRPLPSFLWRFSSLAFSHSLSKFTWLWCSLDEIYLFMVQTLFDMRQTSGEKFYLGVV